MLRKLNVQNYLLIDRLELDLGPGLTVITGETGSGKSILIGALGLLLGDRAEGNLLRDAAKRCVIELEVGSEPGFSSAAEWCERNGLPLEEPLLMRRQLDPGGRSRAFVNDTPVRLEQLRELGGLLVHVHSQHHTLLLNSSAFQLGLVDHFAGVGTEVKQVANGYSAWRKVQEELARLRDEERNAQSERDYLQFQYEELEAARLVAGEQPELERSLSRAEHAGELAGALQGIEEGINADRGIAALLANVRQQTAKAARLDIGVQALSERLQSASIELEDIAEEAARLAGEVSLDPKEAERLRERADLLNRLQQKHHVENSDALIALRDGLKEKIARIGSMEAQLQELEQREKSMRIVWMQQAEALSTKRAKAMEPLSNEVGGQLKKLGMPHAVFSFNQTRTGPAATGIDAVRALFSANKDRAPEPLDKVASGGELGRVMLALIGLAAASKELSTVIFDEIDTGVSGEAADRVGALLKVMSRQRQVIAISHLPQIASKADTHLLVTKDHEAERVQSNIRPLNSEERVKALAQMLSGKKPGKAALENAKELLKAK